MGAEDRGEELMKTCAAIRHRLTTALDCFPLARVEVAFDRLLDEKGEVKSKAVLELAEALEDAAGQISCADVSA